MAIQLLSTNALIETETDLVNLNTALHILNRSQLKEIINAMAISTPLKPVSLTINTLDTLSINLTRNHVEKTRLYCQHQSVCPGK
jgi:hypothetical protein